MNRRKFLGTASCAAIGTTTFFSTLINLGMANAAAARTAKSANTNGNYKALVCILLAGGNDSFNMLVPTDNAAYRDYATTRSNQALAQNSLLKLSPLAGSPPALRLHPAKSAVHQLYDAGRQTYISAPSFNPPI